MGISLDKVQSQAPGLVSLYKDAGVSLQKTGLSTKAKVAIVLDYSGSMSSMYASGFVQRIAEKILALGLQFDDDGDIDVFTFGFDAEHVGELAMGDYQGGVDRLTRRLSWGSTNYAAAIDQVVKHYTGGGGGRKLLRKSSSGPMELPAYVAFFTDGAPDSESAAERSIRNAADKGIFFQFVGLEGDDYPADFSFLERLDQLSGRDLDNAGFFSVAAREIDSPEASDEVLYDFMLKEFTTWVPQAKAKGYIA